MKGQIKHLANSLLQKSQRGAEQAANKVTPAVSHGPGITPLPKHILDHAHEYINHLLAAKRNLR